MHHHKLVDGCRRVEGGTPILCLTPDAPESVVFAAIDDFANRLQRAHVFVFENLPISLDDAGGIDLPGLEAEEQEMFVEGLIPLPFDNCWFETTIPIGIDDHRETFGFLISKEITGFIVSPVRIIHMKAPTEIDGVFVRDYCDFTGEIWRLVCNPGADRIHIDTTDPLHVARYRATTLGINDPQRIMGECGLVSYLMMMLSSKSTQIDQVKSEPKLNKARAKKGRAPIPDHVVVSVVPREVALRMRADGEGSGSSLRASPRLHWRRSHRRTYSSGKVVIIARHLIGYRSSTGDEVIPTHYRVDLGDAASPIRAV